ncbi:hypothetical protein Tco_1192942 [Tanacetum coccineum]
MKIEESLNVKFDETPPPNSPPLVDDDLLEVVIIENQSKDLEVKENEPSNKQISNIEESKDHPLGTVIGNLNQRTLRSQKQTTLAISTTEAEYVSTEKACQQALWMKQALVDYEVKLNDVHVLCDNKGAIDLSKNPVLHSRTKHIEIRHHFLRDNVQKGNISIEKVASKDNIADILTKPLKRESFNLLQLGLRLMEPNV